jgi:hypothetical protein
MLNDWAIFARNSAMHPGDKVRLLHSKEQGIIRRLINPKTAEVEIEDGFTIPVEIRELVVVSRQEDRFFQANSSVENGERASKEAKSTKSPASAKGVYLAFFPKNDREVTLYLINNTDYRWVYALTEKRGEDQRGTIHGVLESKSAQQGDTFFTAQLHNWPEWILEIIWYQAIGYSRPAPSTFSFKARPKSFVNARTNAPVLNKDVFLFQLDAGTAPPVSVNEIKEALFSGKTDKNSNKAALEQVKKGDSVIDLHIESIHKDFANLSSGEILETQLLLFEKALDQALVSGMQEITFIHGVGNGTLRHQIHKRLSQMANQLTFRDAQKEKFGYGATKISFL